MKPPAPVTRTSRPVKGIRDLAWSRASLATIANRAPTRAPSSPEGPGAGGIVARVKRAKTTKFVILTGGRTGSTWVMSSLNSHPEVACFGELFHTGEHTLRVPPRGRQDYLYFDTFMDERARPPMNGRIKRPLLWRSYLDGLYEPRDDVSVIGFKLLYLQARAHPWLLPALAARRVVAVHLIRDNPLDIIVSQDMAQARGAFHAGEGEEVERIQISLDPTTLERRVRREEKKIRAGRAALRATTMPVIELLYDDLVENAAREYDRVFARLGVAPASGDLTTEVQRLNAAPHSETITNYDEVARLLTASGHAHVLQRRG
jgi:LPS sulfotransferase NodH